MNKFSAKIVKKRDSISSKYLSRFFSKSIFLSKMYYMLFSSQFNREMYSVLSGKVKHINMLKNEKHNAYALIRNTHRLEKGLLMRPRKDVFVLGFIKETMDSFESLFSINCYNTNSQMKWSCDVLNEYFKVTKNNEIINKERVRFDRIVNFSLETEIKSIPYHRLEVNKSNITYDDFFKLTRYRRSVRWFLNKAVPHELVDLAVLAANQSPSACNRQPFEYRIIDDPKLLDEVVNIPMGIKGYQNNVPMLIVTVGNLDAYFDERDRHVIYVDASLANMTLMLALETLGLSSCPINWPDIEDLEQRMDTALNLGKYQRPIMCMAIGYPDPDGMVAFSEKRSIDEIRKYN